jgi:hypothetical protein
MATCANIETTVKVVEPCENEKNRDCGLSERVTDTIVNEKREGFEIEQLKTQFTNTYNYCKWLLSETRTLLRADRISEMVEQRNNLLEEKANCMALYKRLVKAGADVTLISRQVVVLEACIRDTIIQINDVKGEGYQEMQREDLRTPYAASVDSGLSSHSSSDKDMDQEIKMIESQIRKLKLEREIDLLRKQGISAPSEAASQSLGNQPEIENVGTRGPEESDEEDYRPPTPEYQESDEEDYRPPTPEYQVSDEEDFRPPTPEYQVSDEEDSRPQNPVPPNLPQDLSHVQQATPPISAQQQAPSQPSSTLRQQCFVLLQPPR